MKSLVRGFLLASALTFGLGANVLADGGFGYGPQSVNPTFNTVDRCAYLPATQLRLIGWTHQAPEIGHYGIDRCRAVAGYYGYECASWDVYATYFASNYDVYDGATYLGYFARCWGGNF